MLSSSFRRIAVKLQQALKPSNPTSNHNNNDASEADDFSTDDLYR